MADCQRCMKCCISLTENGKFSIPITRKDARKLRRNPIFKRFKQENRIDIVKGDYDYMYPFDLVAEGICPFLDQENKACIIYEDRPTNCREFTCSEMDEN